MVNFKVSLLFLLLFTTSGMCAVQNGELTKSIDEYRTYTLARCIKNNYINMGVDFDKARLRDVTTGFIDMEEGVAFSAEKDNKLDAFIESKTRNFYVPKQQTGDLASKNLVIYDCVHFSKSSELGVFLKELLARKVEE